MADSTIKRGSQREYSRVDVYIPLGCRLLDKEEHGQVKSRISADVMLADFKLMPPLGNHPQIASLDLLNQKLDEVIKMVGLQCEGFHSLPFKFVSLSGNGMRFSSQQCYSLGDILECKMILTLQKSAAIYTYGEVVRVGNQSNGYFINVSFTAIDHTIRDKIVRFVFETEREMIRQRKGYD
ncbi:MAG: PilZ domain-containing protein [Deltaproteobacteria bacterium]|nr:MAG: PilZ domain-containing protein [Deltaproteobacteria bacterium]